MVAVIDTDSFQVRDSESGQVYRCTVGSEGFTPAELLGKDFHTSDQTQIHDLFRLGVLIHYLLFGYHPFSGQWTGAGESPEQTELIRQGYWYGGLTRQSSRPPQVPSQYRQQTVSSSQSFHISTSLNQTSKKSVLQSLGNSLTKIEEFEMWITYETGGLKALHQEYPRYIYESKIDLTQKNPKIPNWISDDLRTKIMKRWEIDKKNTTAIQFGIFIIIICLSIVLASMQ